MVSLSGNGIPTGAYTWDDRDHLTSQTSGGITTYYGYSAGGMRVWSQTGSNPKTFYLFDGGLLLGELNAGTTNPIAAYTWGASGLVSERLADSAGSLASGTSLWYAYGPQGETRQLTDSTGAVVDSYLYTSYGVPVSATNNARNPFRYGGQVGYYSDLSTTSGNILCTNRWYNPAASRWLSRDPIGYAGGANLYEYCASNSMTYLDFTGSATVEIRTNKLLGGLANHAYIIIKDTNGETFYVRGGPGSQPDDALWARPITTLGSTSGSASQTARGASTVISPSSKGSYASSNNCSNSANITSPGASRGGKHKMSGPFGTLVTEKSVYKKGSTDYDANPSSVTTIIKDDKPAKFYIDKLLIAANKINNAAIPYNPLTTNSNAAARDMLLSSGIKFRSPKVFLPGWGTPLPYKH